MSKSTRDRLIGVAVAALLVAPAPAMAQRRAAAPAARAEAAPVRTVKGNLRGNVVAVRTAADRPAFDYVITGARLVDGRLELQGSVRPAGRRGAAQGGAASATLVGTLAKEPSPDYNAARARRAAAQRRAEASGAPAEQQQGGKPASTEAAGQIGQLSQSTQSTARETEEPVPPGGEQPEESKAPPAASGTATGCELMFFRMAVPARYAAAAGGRDVQLNVSLARLDNEAGLDLSRRICRVVAALGAGEDAADELADLNRALGAK